MHQTWNALYEARVRKWAGVNRNFSKAIIGGQAITTKLSNIINIFENQYYFSAYHINKKNAIHYLEVINNKSIYYLVGYAMSIYFLALFIEENKLEFKRLIAVLTGSGKLTNEMRETIQRFLVVKFLIPGVLLKLVA